MAGVGRHRTPGVFRIGQDAQEAPRISCRPGFRRDDGSRSDGCSGAAWMLALRV